MKLTLNRSALHAALSRVGRALSNRSSLPILSMVRLELNPGAGALHLTATNLDLTLSTQVPALATGTDAFAVCLPAAKLTKIVGLIPAEELTLVSDDKRCVTLTGASSVFKLHGLSVDEFPPAPVVKAKPVTLPQINLAHLLRLTAFCMSEDATRYVLNGTLLSLNGMVRMVGTDGRRLSHAAIQPATELEKVEAILPSYTVTVLQALLGEEGAAELALEANRAQFTIGDTVLVTKLVEGNYPNWRQVVPTESLHTITVDRETLLGAVRRQSLLTSEKTNGLTLTFDGGALTLSITGEAGSGTETLSTSGVPKPVAICFNADYLREALASVSSGNVLLHLTDALSPGVLTIPDDPEFKHVLMPMRMA